MLRLVSAAVLTAAMLLGPATSAAPAQDPATSKPHHAVHKRPRLTVRHWHGYGFLPGYRPPEEIARERAEQARHRPQIFVYGDWMDNPLEQPRFFHGRWNGGGFGPCWTYTPIGMMWNCGQ
ncbi:MAG TPA: hypothetical protein VHT93_01615 [Pseudolabrys sp.]|jgi:hypothetical protein|nr:hypothetical protein [Pseudolabrys sp.]